MMSKCSRRQHSPWTDLEELPVRFLRGQVDQRVTPFPVLVAAEELVRVDGVQHHFLVELPLPRLLFYIAFGRSVRAEN